MWMFHNTNNQLFVSHQITLLKNILYLKDSYLFSRIACFHFSCINQSESYSILDAKYYASNSKIESEGVDYNHQRLIFVSDYEVSYDDVIHFRFGNTVPNTVGLGISSKSYSNDVFIEKTGSTTKLYRNILSTATLNNPFVANHDFCMKPIANSPNDQCWLYDNDTYIDWYSFKLTNKRVRVDKYYSYPFTIEIIVL